jgi:hypothetical protein
MNLHTPFPGMDPYLEHPSIWEGVHARLIVAFANQLQPQLDPRYIATIEERVFIEGPQQRIPDVWIQKSTDDVQSPARSAPDVDTAVVIEVEDLEIHQTRIEIRDAYNDMKLVTLIELLSPTNKRPGPGRESYLAKQREILAGDGHLVEIDLLRVGERALCVPSWRLQEFEPFDYVACVNRWPKRNRYEVYACRLEQRLPRIAIPLADPDPDVRLDVQATLDQVYSDGRYRLRLRYDEPCEPPLDKARQQWAKQLESGKLKSGKLKSGKLKS